MLAFLLTGDCRNEREKFGTEGLRGPEPALDVLYQGFAARSRARLRVLSERIMVAVNFSEALHDRWTALADVGGLFERIAQLQYAPIVVVTADDLNANGKAAG
jgi:hypothetical protein